MSFAAFMILSPSADAAVGEAVRPGGPRPAPAWRNLAALG
jgi:hypothetical protein